MKAYTMQVILMLLLLRGSLQECSQGCLKCSSDNQCEYCDFTLNYYLQDGSCQLGQIDNCETYTVEGLCLQCQPNYYLDEVTGQCLSVTETVRIDNCTYYETENACMVCEPLFYLNGLNCSAVTITIDNCKMYSGIDKCGECNDGYIIQHDQKGCLKEQEVQNCQTFTSVRCNNCQSDYYLQKNYWNVWIAHLLKTNLARKEERALNASLATKVITSGNCTSIIPKKCAQLKDFQTCHICQVGYFLKEGDCFENPPLSIPNCEDYSQEDRCRKCEQGYRLTPAPNYKCKAVENVQFCINFDGEAFETRCLECKERYYLKFDNLCEERTITVEFCLEHEIKKDQCAKCESGFQLTSDGKKCLQETPSCASYLESDITTEKVICEECNEYHYLNIENLCTLGTTENCRVYERIYDQCRLCEDNYFLNADLQCQQHPLIDGCSKYDPYVSNRCRECQFDRFLLTLQTECQSVQVDNCRLHKTIDHCAECKQGYSLLNNGQCTELDPDLHCLVGEYGLCIKCEEGYTIEQGICIIQLIYEKNICQLSEMPIDYKSALQCTSKEDLVRLGLDAGVFDNGNCDAFEYDEDFNYKCVKCAATFEPDQTGACVATSTNPECTDDTTFFYRSLNYKVKKEQENLVYVQDNVCLRITKNDPAEINHCKNYGISKGQFNSDKDVQYGCLGCQDATSPEGQFQIVEPSSNRETLFKDSTNIFWKTDFQCELKNSGAGDFTDIVWGDASSIANCEYFQKMQHDKIGCMRCKNGFNGVIKNQAIDKCLEYDPVNLQCTKCQENFLLEENNKKCTFHSALATARSYTTNCELESFDETKCYQCAAGYTLKDDGSECFQNTSGHPINNCAAHTHNSAAAIVATCERCDDDYYLTSDKQNCWQVPNCKVPASATTCAECDLTYELNGTNTCDLVANCDYNNLNSSDCLVVDTYNISTLNKCTSVTIAGCEAYDQVNAVCTKCESGKYLFVDTNTTNEKVSECVAENSFPSTTILPGITHTSSDCKRFGVIDVGQAFNTALRYGCLECKTGYYLFNSSQKGLADYNCIQNSYVDKASDNNDTNNLLLAEFANNTNCDLYDFLQDECSQCKTGSYWSTDYCCILTEYYNGVSCVTINTTDYPDCNKLEMVKDQGSYQCIGCATGTNTLVDGFCKATADNCDHISNGACVVKSGYDCDTYDIRQNECSTCSSSHYIVPAERKDCCDDSSFIKADGACGTLSDDLSIAGDSDKETNIKASCLQYDLKSGICLKCATGKSFTGRICVDTDDLYDNCAKIDNHTNLCETCDTNFHLNEFGACCSTTDNFFDIASGTCTTITAANAVTNCMVYSVDAANSCKTCKDGYWNNTNKACCKNGEYLHDPSTNSEDCQYPSEKYQYCLLYEFDSATSEQYKCQLCNPNYSSQLTNGTVETCCPHGKKPSASGDCESDTACKISKNGSTQCYACPLAKQLISDESCVTPSSNCDVATTAAACTQCNFKHIVNSNSSNVCETAAGVDVHGKYNCGVYDSTNGASPKVCTSCLDSLQIGSTATDSCCPIGTYKKADNLCIAIPVENCAVYDSTNDKCTKCFQDDDHCTVEYDFIATMGANLKLRYLYKVGYDNIRSSIDQQYYLGNDTKQNCCKYGYYYNGSSCVEIETDNCQEYDYQNHQCKECMNDYILVGGVCNKLDPSQCQSKNGSTIYYNSNDHCCPQNKYWNEDLELCEDIPDSNCIESNDGINCTQCSTGKVPQSFVKVQYQLHYRATIDNCPHIHKHRAFYKCIPTADKTTYDGYTQLATFEQIAENCKEVDYAKKECTECLSGFYRPEGVNICCADGSVAVEVNGQHFCRVISTIDDNCVNFDTKTNKCLECQACNTDFAQGLTDKCQLSGGMCCKRFQHFNIMTGLCENMLLGECQDVDLEAKMCNSCPDGYYFYHTGCVKEGYSFSDLTMTGVTSETVSGNTSVCLQKSPQGHCAVCNVKPGGGSVIYYNYKGLCVKQKTNDQSDTAISGTGFVDTTTTSTVVCLELDSYDNCTKCDTGYFLTSGRCCKNNEYWNGSACAAPAVSGCETANPLLTTEQCIECSGSNILLKIEKPSNTATQTATCDASLMDQLDENLLWGNAAPDTIAEKVSLAQIQSTLNCVVFEDGKCAKCASGFVLALKTIDVSITSTADDRQYTRCITGTNLDNCTYHDADDITKCLFCDGTKKLLNDTCTGDAITHCSKSDANGCLKCNGNYLIRTEADWSSGSEVLNKTCWFNTIGGCTELDNNSLICKRCADNYVLDFQRQTCSATLTTLDGIVSNCISGVSTILNNSTFVCFACKKDFFLASSTSCTAVTPSSEVDDCKVHDSLTTCSECVTGYYVVNEGLKCCANGTIFYNDSCVDWTTLTKDNCTKVEIQTSSTYYIEKVQCQACATNYQLTNGICCPENKIGMERFCYTPTSKRSTDCKILDNTGRCGECESTHYLTNGGCCTEGQYFDTVIEQCQAIADNYLVTSASNATVNCLRVNSDNECTKCDASGRLYNGICYDASHSIDPTVISSATTTATNEHFPKCTEVIDNECTQCDSTFSLGGGKSSEKCCGKSGAGNSYYYDSDDQKCKLISDNCTTFDNDTNTCTQCASNYYSTGLSCCQANEFFNTQTSVCAAISTLTGDFKTNCQELTQEDNLNKQCSKCASNYSLLDGICYKTDSLIDNCESKVSEDCLTCKNDNIISGLEVSVCCSDGDIFNATTKQCETTAGLANCKNQLSATKCSECDPEYYLLNEDTCCEVGKKPNGTACAAAVSIEHCIEWGTRDGDDICLTCKTGFKPYDYIKSGDYKTKCCADSTFLDPVSEECINKNTLTNTIVCDAYDVLFQVPYYRLPICTDIPASNYISNNFICADGTEFTASSSSCTTIVSATYPNCNQVSDGKCLNCTTGNLISGKCCADTEFSNGTAACASSTANGLTTCKIFYEECPKGQFDFDCSTFTIGSACKECSTGNYLTYNYKCCPTGEYWDTTDSICKDYTTANVGDDHKSNIETNCVEFGKEYECLSCGAITPSDDGKNCCATTSEFVDTAGACSDTYTIQTSCKIYNHTQYKCTECSDNFYLTLGKCCANGKYYERSSNLCKDINTTTLKIDAQCNQYDEEKKCLSCNSGFEINYDQDCIAVPTGCKVFDANTLVCDECNDNFSLSEFGNCCATDQLDSYGVCKVIETQMQINNCEEYFRGKCSKCEASHYLIQGECCPDETYYDRDSTSNPPCTAYSSSDYNNVENCKEYGYAKEFCDVCKDNYMLVRYLWGDKCVSLEPSSTKHISNCIKYKNQYNGTSSIEEVKCTECSFAIGALFKLEDEATATTATDILPELKKKLVSECVVYHITSQFQASTFACIKCSDNFYLNKKNECSARSTLNVAQCVGNKPLNKDECDQCDDGYFINYLKQCELISMPNCIHYDREKEVCLKCTSTLDVAASSGTYNQQTDPDEDTTYRQMRLKYYLVNDYVRSKCSLEKHTPETFPDHYLGYVDSCTADAAQTNKLAINLDNFYDKWYPVHFCTDTAEIPIAFVKAGKDQTGMPYGIGNYSSIDLTTQTTLDIDDIDEQVAAGLTFDKGTNFGKSTHCITTYTDVFAGQSGDPKTVPIANCAMIMTNVEMPFETTQAVQANPDFSILSTFCTACQTGFAPVRNGFLPIVVNSCNSIANCDTSDATSPKVLNGCPKCTKDTSTPANNYAFKVNDEGTVDYTSCVQTDDIHCELLNQDDTCKYCESGYLPNYDGKCAQYRSPNCNDANFSFLKGFTVDNFEYVLSYLGTQKGCTDCATGYKGLLIETKKLVCSQSTTLETQDFESDSTVYDGRCEQYGIIDDKAVCTLCSPGYLLDLNRKCLLTTLENCSIVESATKCSQCSGEFILQNGNCVQQVIENCDKHNINQAGDPICSECEDTYLLSNDVCVKGPVENCRTYNDIPTCTQCMDNYVLVTLKDGSQQCSAINQEIHPNCVQYKSDSFNDNQVECIQCSTLEFLPVYYEIDQDICLQLEVIDNCIKYDKEPLFVHSSLKCLECEQKYVLQNDKCEERKVTVEHCTEYSKYEHKCTECTSDYYLSADGINCILEPSGIPNCDVYSDYDQCKHCKDHTYLYKNECVNVPTTIENCKYYQDSASCALCQDGMILENNQCKEYKVTCLTYLSSTECATCPEGQGIKYENDKRICAIFNVVQYCDVHEQIEPYKCKKCLSGYFLYEELPRNKCVRAITTVGNCVEYSAPEDCSLCAEGYLLSFDLKSCIEKTFNDNCSSRSEVQPYCVQCKSGFILDNEDQCVEDNSDLPNGCLGYDKNGNCHMCMTGYYQNSEKQCTKV